MNYSRITIRMFTNVETDSCLRMSLQYTHEDTIHLLQSFVGITCEAFIIIFACRKIRKIHKICCTKCKSQIYGKIGYIYIFLYCHRELNIQEEKQGQAKGFSLVDLPQSITGNRPRKMTSKVGLRRI